MEHLYQFDMDGFRAINQGFREPWLDPIFTALSYSGLGITLTIAILSLVIWKSTRSYVIPLLVSLFVSGYVLADWLFKDHIERDRPSNLASAVREEAWKHTSFPSGHSSVAFSTAFMLLFLTWGTPRAKWAYLALLWAAGVGISRMYRGVHWPTDVLGGLCVGLLSAGLVYVVYSQFLQKPLTT